MIRDSYGFASFVNRYSESKNKQTRIVALDDVESVEITEEVVSDDEVRVINYVHTRGGHSLRVRDDEEFYSLIERWLEWRGRRLH